MEISSGELKDLLEWRDNQSVRASMKRSDCKHRIGAYDCYDINDPGTNYSSDSCIKYNYDGIDWFKFCPDCGRENPPPPKDPNA